MKLAQSITVDPAAIELYVEKTEMPVNSISDYIDFVRKGQPDIATFIYRAQPSVWIGVDGLTFETFLFPSIFRQHMRPGGSLTELEAQMLTDFQREAPSMLMLNPQTEIEWMALAQHHGVPTRLLDWTTNPLVALFFAVEKNDSEFDARIYRGKVYDPQIYDNSDDRDTTSFDQDIAPFRFYMPKYVDRRLEAQSSCFTLHPQMELYEQARYYHHFTKLLPHELQVETCTIPKERFGAIKAELYEVGVSHKTLFPGLDGLGRTITYSRTAQRESIREPWPQKNDDEQGCGAKGA